MCGIVALITKKKTAFTFKHSQMFENMLYLDYLRGEDSTGVFTVNKYGNVAWEKATDTPTTFLKEAKLLNHMVWDLNVVVGHNRKATKGTIKDENAHPFAEDNIILVHNGTLDNHKDLNESVEVDSHAIAHAIKEFGVEETIAKLEGAFAVVAYDVNCKKVYAFRNKERPLYLLDLESVWALSSEPWIAYGSAWRNGLPPGKVQEIPPATLLTFDLNDENAFVLSEKEVKLYEKKKPPTIIRSFPKNIGTSTKKSKVEEFIQRFSKGNNVVFIPEEIKANGISWVIVGKHAEFENVRVRADCSAIDYTEHEVHTLLHQSALVATISGISYNSVHDNGTVFAEDPTVSLPMVSVNGTILNEEFIDNLSGVCYKCKKDIDEEELEASYVKMHKKGKRTVMVCPSCVEEHLIANPNWGGIRAYEETYHSMLHKSIKGS